MQADHWGGRFRCPECGEPFAFNREASAAEFQDAYLQVAHVHDGGVATWTGSVYRHRKGQRYPEDVRALRLIVQGQKRAARKRR